jgi:hypothetical protein
MDMANAQVSQRLKNATTLTTSSVSNTPNCSCPCVHVHCIMSFNSNEFLVSDWSQTLRTLFQALQSSSLVLCHSTRIGATQRDTLRSRQSRGKTWHFTPHAPMPIEFPPTAQPPCLSQGWGLARLPTLPPPPPSKKQVHDPFGSPALRCFNVAISLPPTWQLTVGDEDVWIRTLQTKIAK